MGRYSQYRVLSNNSEYYKPLRRGMERLLVPYLTFKPPFQDAHMVMIRRGDITLSSNTLKHMEI